MMSNFNAKQLVQAMSIQARIDSMKADNAVWAARGQSPAYTESDFLGYANDLENIARSMEHHD